MPLKYPVPEAISEQIGQAAYQRWLNRIASAHVRRDRKRGNAGAKREGYMISIHAAVVSSRGRDAYTGEDLRWDLLSTYDNLESAGGGRTYKAKFALQPSVDHVGDGLGPAEFRICAWRTNQAKSDLTLENFVELCRRVVSFHERGDRRKQSSGLDLEP